MTPIDRRAFVKTTVGLAAASAISPALAERLGRLAAPVRAAVVGCGRQGRAIVAELSSFADVTLAGLCDSEPRRLDAAQRRAPGVEGYTDHRALLDAAAPDALFVATPTHRHREIVEHALQAGVAVYCEAPMAHTPDDARAIASAARNAGVPFQAGYLARANPVYDLARSFFRSDSVRDLVSMEAARARKTSWRTPARTAEQDRALNWRLDPEVTTGLAGEWGSHQFDVFHWYTGRYPTRVTGAGSIRLHDDGRTVHDTIACSLVFDRGEIATYSATLANSYEGMHELLRGTNAAIKLAWTHGWMFKEADAPTQGWEVYANRQQFHNDEGITLIAGATQLAEQGKLKEGVGLPHTPLWYGLETFLKSVTEGTPVVCTADDGLRSTIVGIKTHEAITTGREVTIDPAELG
ncbi:MAG: Gfo/Idh/MocA family protein [Phycisphaerales bacterium]